MYAMCESERYGGLPYHPDKFKKALEELDGWIECYKKFEVDYWKIHEGWPPLNDPKYFLGLFETSESQRIRERQRLELSSWSRAKHAELSELIDKYIIEYGERFYFRISPTNAMYGKKFEIEGRNHHSLGTRGRDNRYSDIERHLSYLHEVHTRYQKKLTIRLRIDAKEDRELEKKRRASVKKKKNRALIAKATGTSRNLAATIKKQLSSSHPCPYCGKALGTDFHADHIYPVIKGGLSTIQNMVNVCSSCNLAKRDLTLSAFIRKFGLNRDEIESRLEALGKEF